MLSSINLPSRSAALPANLVEAVLVLVAVALLVPVYLRLADAGAGRDQRYAEHAIGVGAMPPPVLPRLCSDFGKAAEAPLRRRLCDGTALGAEAPPTRLPAVVAEALGGVRQSMHEPIRQAQTRLAELRLQQSDEAGDLLAIANDIAALEAEIEPYLRRYSLDTRGQTGPLPLLCAAGRIDAALGVAAAAPATRANAALLLGAALDGRRGLETLAATAIAARGGDAQGACRLRRCRHRHLARSQRRVDERGTSVAEQRAQERSDARAAADRRLAVGRLDGVRPGTDAAGAARRGAAGRHRPGLDRLGHAGLDRPRALAACRARLRAGAARRHVVERPLGGGVGACGCRCVALCAGLARPSVAAPLHRRSPHGSAIRGWC